MTIQVELKEKEFSFDLGFSEESRFDIHFSESFSPRDIEPYSGAYEVIPKVAEQSLQTRDRWMNRDVTVTAIPYHEVENMQRGTTAIIGGI